MKLLKLIIFTITLGPIAVVHGNSVQVDQNQALPEPLTLDFVLSLAEETHPDILLAMARKHQAEAGYTSAQASDDLSIGIKGALRYVDPPSYSPIQTNDDNSLEIYANKLLYDFGRTDALVTAAKSYQQSYEYYLDIARRNYKLRIMQAYFDVVLADMLFYRYNEEMAIAYIAYDRVKDRRELGQASDLDVLQEHSNYQRVRHLRFDSQNKQRLSRAHLANVLNRPGQLPATVVPPELNSHKRKLPDENKLLEIARQHSPQLQAIRSELVAATAHVDQARASDNGTLSANVTAGTYSRERGGYDDMKAELVLEIPLYDGNRNDAAVAQAKAKEFELQAQLRNAEMDLSQQILGLWLELDGLRSKFDEVETQNEYRELYLDRSRALYELEVKTDLGDAMVRMSDAQRGVLETKFRIELAWQRLEALIGQELPVEYVPEKSNTGSDSEETDQQQGEVQ